MGSVYAPFTHYVHTSLSLFLWVCGSGRLCTSNFRKEALRSMMLIHQILRKIFPAIMNISYYKQSWHHQDCEVTLCNHKISISRSTFLPPPLHSFDTHVRRSSIFKYSALINMYRLCMASRLSFTCAPKEDNGICTDTAYVIIEVHNTPTQYTVIFVLSRHS